MKKADLIRLAKPTLIELMATDKIKSAADEMAKILFLFNEGYTLEEDITKMKNMYRLTNDSGVLKFNTIADGIITAIEANVSFGNLDAKFEKEKHYYINGNKLGKLDREALARKAKNVVDLPQDKTRPQVDVYTVKDGDKEIVKTESLEVAEKAKEKAPSANIYDSRARLVTKNPERIFGNGIKTKAYVAGTTVECNNVHLYYNLDDNAPGRVISGTYYLITGNLLRGGRYSVCKSMDNPKCIGYISRSQIEKTS